MIKITPPERTVDAWGQGHYGAPRGSRKHNGIDFACYPNSGVLANKSGKVTKLGFPYADDADRDGRPDYDYIQITDSDGFDCRYFYVKPAVKVGSAVWAGDLLGTSQELGTKYDKITEHIHIEVKDPDGKFIDPMDYLS